MARPLRIQEAGMTYHVTANGVAGLPAFRDASDRRFFLSLLGEVVLRHGWLCTAYCLMTTHYHLLVRTPEPDIAVGMKRLNQLYAQRFNHRHGGRGHVFESRYGATYVRSEAHLLGAVRYIALNPVAAGIVSDPARWRWGSYRFVVSRGPCPPFLARDWLLGLFGLDLRRARERLEAFVAAREDELVVESWAPRQASPVAPGRAA